MLLGQIELLEKLIENGIIAAAFLYILHWLLNRQSQEMAENSKRAQLSSLEIATSIRGLVNAVNAMQQQLMTHDLTMSGLNPDFDTSFEERDSLALKKYDDVMASLREQRELLRGLNLEADARMSAIRNG